MIAVGSNDANPASGGKVLIYEYSENTRRWIKVETLVTIVDAVHDVAFAPSTGRSYHLLAIAGRDVRIIILKPMQFVCLLSPFAHVTLVTFFFLPPQERTRKCRSDRHVPIRNSTEWAVHRSFHAGLPYYPFNFFSYFFR